MSMDFLLHIIFGLEKNKSVITSEESLNADIARITQYARRKAERCLAMGVLSSEEKDLLRSALKKL